MKRLACLVLAFPLIAFAAEHGGAPAPEQKATEAPAESKEHAGAAAEHAGQAAESKEHAGAAAEHAGQAAESKEHAGAAAEHAGKPAEKKL
jgi:ParB-like chromosome segregation protein Spo0J